MLINADTMLINAGAMLINADAMLINAGVILINNRAMLISSGPVILNKLPSCLNKALQSHYPHRSLRKHSMNRLKRLGVELLQGPLKSLEYLHTPFSLPFAFNSTFQPLGTQLSFIIGVMNSKPRRKATALLKITLHSKHQSC
jgi:hypothetical protein